MTSKLFLPQNSTEETKTSSAPTWLVGKSLLISGALFATDRQTRCTHSQELLDKPLGL